MANPYVDPDAGLSPQERMIKKLEGVVRKYEVSVAEANDLVVLTDYDIVFVCDDSGSMNCSAQPAHMRKLGAASKTRWDELKETVANVVELAACFDSDGIDVYFLNRPPVLGVKSAQDSTFLSSLSSSPSGGTPLSQAVTNVVKAKGGEKPVLMIIATDGVPNEGPSGFKKTIAGIIEKKSTSGTFKFQILACTDDDSEIGWLNEFDAKFTSVDVMDDYYSERAEVLKLGLFKDFKRFDYVVKAMLGPVSPKFDILDEKKKKKSGKPTSTKADECCIVM